MGVKDYCEFDINIVRGLAYYTGAVFEIFDRSSRLRAICAGGRYDNLLAALGGPQISGTGFGMGDVVLSILLEEKKLLSGIAKNPDFFIIDADNELFDEVLKTAGILRSKGFSAVFDYKRSSLGKQLKQASLQNARLAVIIGSESLQSRKAAMKNLSDSSQKEINFDEFLENPGVF